MGTTIEERFWPKVDQRGPDECWPWMAYIAPDGYGRIGEGGKYGRKLGAHRVSLELALGRPLREGMDSCHTCDNRLCVNPAHLFEGTRDANVQDMMSKGRHWAQKRTHCKRGHELNPENTYTNTHARRGCLVCKRASGLAYYHRQTT